MKIEIKKQKEKRYLRCKAIDTDTNTNLCEWECYKLPSATDKYDYFSEIPFEFSPIEFYLFSNNANLGVFELSCKIGITSLVCEKVLKGLIEMCKSDKVNFIINVMETKDKSKIDQMNKLMKLCEFEELDINNNGGVWTMDLMKAKQTQTPSEIIEEHFSKNKTYLLKTIKTTIKYYVNAGISTPKAKERAIEDYVINNLYKNKPLDDYIDELISELTKVL